MVRKAAVALPIYSVKSDAKSKFCARLPPYYHDYKLGHLWISIDILDLFEYSNSLGMKHLNPFAPYPEDSIPASYSSRA